MVLDGEERAALTVILSSRPVDPEVFRRPPVRKRILPDPRDAVITRVVARITDPASFAAVAADLPPHAYAPLQGYAFKMATSAVRNHDRSCVRNSMMALALAYVAKGADWRDVMVVVSLAMRAAERIGLDSVAEMEAVAAIVDSNAADFLRRFAHRLRTNRAITLFGFMEGEDEDGFCFIQELPTWGVSL